jgi:ABC-2 type transport system permease protein
MIYLIHNLAALESVLPGGPATELQLLSVDGQFFMAVFIAESFLSFFLVSFIGPGLISPDLANNALPLYLSRPLTRSEYVVGKLAVLVSLISVITWIPGLLLMGMQSSFEGVSWLVENSWLAAGILVGSWIWMLTISLLALALSAWVKYKPVATASLVGVFFIAAAFGNTMNEMLDLDPEWGYLLNLPATMNMIWSWFFLERRTFQGVPAWAGLLSMSIVCLLCLVMLQRKIRASEVVR